MAPVDRQSHVSTAEHPDERFAQQQPRADLEVFDRQSEPCQAAVETEGQGRVGSVLPWQAGGRQAAYRGVASIEQVQMILAGDLRQGAVASGTKVRRRDGPSAGWRWHRDGRQRGL
jgi:hypothetical protein